MNREAERKRLVELLNDEINRPTQFTLESIADHLLDNGIVVPPCKVGQTVYALVIDKIEEFVVVSVELSRASGFSFMASNGIYPMLYNDNDIGKTVFLTREQAEKTLEGKGE